MTSIKVSIKKGELSPDTLAIEAARNILVDQKVKWVLCAFTDIRGIFQSFSSPVSHFVEGEQYFETGIGFDGSSIRGFKELHTSDMIFYPDPEALYILPWTSGE